MNKVRYIILLWLIVGCRESFIPDFETGVDDFLVVEGFIHAGTKRVTTIELSRVIPLGQQVRNPEIRASVSIEAEDGDQFYLTETDRGKYQTDSLSLPVDKKYRLRIITRDAAEYASEWVSVSITTAINDVTWSITQSQVVISVQTTAPNATSFYKWDFSETWELHSDYQSAYYYEFGEFKPRSPEEMNRMYFCWRNARPNKLFTLSHSPLAGETINYPLTQIFLNSERTSVRYSIMVEQRSLTEAAYNYLQIIEKNTSISGSLFDPLPSEVQGNIYSINENAQAKVIGFMGASTTDYKRIFILANDLNPIPNAKCPAETFILSQFESAFRLGGGYMPISVTFVRDEFFQLNPVQATGAAPYCLDCRLKGGSPVPPDFW
ncbi:MAG: DUF4249 domain-containing protein [Cytophagales bacterium]|nr:DUF4249 domain-containing protein [Cytophagales bacterium]